MDELSQLQKDVVEMLKQGKTVKQMSQERGVSVQSIYQVLKRLEKLGLIQKRYKPNFDVV